MTQGLRAVSHTMNDIEAVAASDRARFQKLVKQEKERIIKRDLATWVDPETVLSWTQKKAILWDRSMGRCHYCQDPMNPFSDFTVDHVLARVLGGTDDLENLVACCRTCNTRKREKDIGAWWKLVRR